MRCCVVALGPALLLLSSAVASAQESLPPIDSLLVIEPLARSERVPIQAEPVLAALARGTWRTPAEGDSLSFAGRTNTWRRIEAADGDFHDRALRGGWAVATVASDRPRIVLLAARGHGAVYVNGTPRGGDVYDLGITRLPIALQAGDNELLFHAGRGHLQVRLETPAHAVGLETQDRTLPDVLAGEAGELWAGIVATNATDATQRELRVTTRCGELEDEAAVAPLPPCSQRKLAIPFRAEGAPGSTVEVEVTLWQGETELDHTSLELPVRAPHERHRRTFVSDIDGSVQYFAVTPAAPDAGADAAPALFLSLHGAGVEASGQAAAYAPKSWGVVIAPTNRRPFGFDWEDWGRLDALEVLDLGQRLYHTDPRRTYLVGHSMGGHGTWSLGAMVPGRFAAIAPSAGWCDFWTYTGRDDADESTLPPPAAAMRRAANISHTLLLLDNTKSCGVYVLHGDADDNVPVREARAMRQRLATFHSDFAYYERPGAGHWWGNACVDWPPLFHFLQDHELPDRPPLHVAFSTVDPAIDARCHWVTIEQQMQPLEVSHLDVSVDGSKRTITVDGRNVARCTLDLGPLGDALPSGQPITVAGATTATLPWPQDGVLHLARDGSAWTATAPLDPHQKGPLRAGPFKDAFRHRVLLVYGTAGSAEENAWSYHRARYDAETFAYRGNGAFEVCADTDFDPTAEADRSIVLYGNRATNRAWSELLPDSPVQVDRDAVTVGEQRLAGDDLACLFARPRPGSDVAMVAAVAGTGLCGLRTTEALPYFVSGVHFPDWTVVRTSALEGEADGLVDAGFFANDWSLEPR